MTCGTCSRRLLSEEVAEGESIEMADEEVTTEEYILV
jgi:ferredoxin